MNDTFDIHVLLTVKQVDLLVVIHRGSLCGLFTGVTAQLTDQLMLTMLAMLAKPSSTVWLE